MKTRLKRYENVNGQWVKIQSEIVEFVEITGDRSARIIDSKGKKRTVRRANLLDVPQHVLYPDIQIVGRQEPDPEVWKKACYFD